MYRRTVPALRIPSGQYRYVQEAFPVERATSGKTTRQINAEHLIEARVANLRAEVAELEAQLAIRAQESEVSSQSLLTQAKDEASRVMQDAEQHAFEQVQSAHKEGANVVEVAKREAEGFLSEARTNYHTMMERAHQEMTEEQHKAHALGLEEGRAQGLQEALPQLEFLSRQFHAIVERTLEERNRILVESEAEVVETLLATVEKVVKHIQDSDKDLAVRNLQDALQPIRTASTVLVRTHPADLTYLESFASEMARLVEAQDIRFLADESLDRGGVLVQMENGVLDASIASQVQELRSIIESMVPTRSVPLDLEEVVPASTKADAVAQDMTDLGSDVAETVANQPSKVSDSLSQMLSIDEMQALVTDDEVTRPPLPVDDRLSAETSNSTPEEYPDTPAEDSEGTSP